MLLLRVGVIGHPVPRLWDFMFPRPDLLWTNLRLYLNLRTDLLLGSLGSGESTFWDGVVITAGDCNPIELEFT